MALLLALLMTAVMFTSLQVSAYDDNPNDVRPLDDDFEYAPTSYTPLSDGTYMLLSSPGDREEYLVNLTDAREPVSAIGDNAFSGSKTVKKVTLGENVRSVGNRAFSDCENLKTVVIPATVTQIGKDAFAGCPDVSLYVAADSAGAAYAIENSLSYTVWDINDCWLSRYYYYGGTTVSLGVSLGATTLEADKDYTYQYTLDYENMVGTLTVNGIGMYSGTYTETHELSAYYPIENLTVELEQSSYIYDGTAKRPRVTVYSICPVPQPIDNDREPTPFEDFDDFNGVGALGEDDGEYVRVDLVEGRDYTLSYAQNVNIGTATVTVNGKGMYYGSTVREFTIAGKSLAGASASLNPTSFTYDGTPKVPRVTVTQNGKTLTEGEDYTVLFSKNANAGTAQATILGAGNYSGTLTKTFTINRRSISDASVSLTQNEYVYDGKAKTPDVIALYNGRELTEGEDYCVSYSANTAVGNASAVVTGIGNFSGSVSRTFTIKSAVRSIADCNVQLENLVFRYDGTAHKPDVTVKDGTELLTQGTDYTVAYASNVNAGDAVVTVTGKGSYTGSVSKKFYILPKSISSSMITKVSAAYTYNGKAQPFLHTVSDGGKALVEGVDYELSYENNINAGRAEVVFNGKGNYGGSTTVTYFYTIEPRAISDAYISLTGTSFTYDGTAKKPPAIVSYNGEPLREGTDYTLSYSNNTNPGTATVTVSGTGNFTSSVSRSFTISGKGISNLNATLSEDFYLYDGDAHKPAVTVKDGDNLLVSGTDYTVSYSNYINAGTATVTITGKGRYNGTSTLSYIIGRRHICFAEGTLSATSYPYDGSAKMPTLTLKYNSKTLRSGTDYKFSYQDNTNPGTAHVNYEGLGNFYGTDSKTFTITKKSEKFTWGQDNWKFTNNDLTTYAVDADVRRKLQSDFNLSYTDIINDLNKYAAKNYKGSCHGFTSTQILVKQGGLELSRYGCNSAIHSNSLNSKSRSVINFFQATQLNGIVAQSIRRDSYKNYSFTQYDAISMLENTLKNNDKMVNLCFRIYERFTKASSGYRVGDTLDVEGHSILAYGVETLSKSKTFENTGNKEFDKRILIADPNALSLDYAYPDCCLYYNSSDHSWIIPFYNDKNYYKDGDEISYWLAGTSEYSTGRISKLLTYNNFSDFSDMLNPTEADRYIAGLRLTNASDNEAAVAQLETLCNSNLTYQAGDSDSNIKQYGLYELDEMNNDNEYYALYNPTAAYGFSYDQPNDYSASMDYEDVLYTIDVTNSDTAQFYPEGSFLTAGSDMDYTLSMVTNDSLCVTDFYQMKVTGGNADKVMLQKVRDGYVLTATNLKDISLEAVGADAEASCSFTTDFTSVYIYEIDEHTIGIRADADNDGDYETEIPVSGKEPQRDPGDVNLDGVGDIADATYVQMYAAGLIRFSDEQLALGDVNGDNVVDITDATRIQMMIAGLV